MLILTPRIYRQNLKWIIAPQNKIDTVTMSPILNVVGTDPSEFHTISFTTAKVNLNDVTLPVSNNLVPTHRRIMYNKAGSTEYAKGRVDIVMAYGRRQFTLEVPVEGIPNVALKLNGTSSVCARGGNTYNNLPTVDQMRNSNYSLASWIETNKTNLNQQLTHIYESTSFKAIPFVRNIKPYVLGGDPVTPNDVITNWAGAVQTGRNYAGYNYWNHEEDYLLSETQAQRMLPPNTSVTDIINAINVIGDERSISVSINRLNKYTYEVFWIAPVRFAYAAASRYTNLIGTPTDFDNYAYVDNITSVDVVLIGKPYNTDDISLSYSLDKDGNVVEDAINNWVNKIDKSEVVTMNSTLGGNDWKTSIAKLLLDKYIKGKYLVQCDVPAEWVLTNDVHINTQLQVAQQDSSLITRKNVPCVFEVKTITKRFRASEFFYTLGLMEV